MTLRTASTQRGSRAYLGRKPFWSHLSRGRGWVLLSPLPMTPIPARGAAAERNGSGTGAALPPAGGDRHCRGRPACPCGRHRHGPESPGHGPRCRRGVMAPLPTAPLPSQPPPSRATGARKQSGWETPLRSASSTCDRAPPPQLHHGTQCPGPSRLNNPPGR